MSNILNHNRDIFQIGINKDEYWDFHVSLDSQSYRYHDEWLNEKCLAAYIDINDNNCVWWDDIFSKENYVWDYAVNNGLTFNSFGFTGVDNGKITYEKDKISNKEFLQIFTNTKYEIEKNDLRLKLSKVEGNHKLYKYTNDIVLWEKYQVSRLNGGWYQGFFCANDGLTYKTLPTDLGNGWSLEFELNKEDFIPQGKTLNDVYPQNKGIFFYIGTRAENKWWVKYKTNYNFEKVGHGKIIGDYVNDEYITDKSLNDDYFSKIVGLYRSENYNNDSYFSTDYLKDETIESNLEEEYVENGYYNGDIKLDENTKLLTKNGYDLYQPNIKEMKTDNKFLMFDRTCEGLTVEKWKDNTELTLHYIEKPKMENYFSLFNRTCNGYNVCNIASLINIENKRYDVLDDIYRNCFALQIKDNGSIGYKYIIKYCNENGKKGYKVETEFTPFQVIKYKTWHTIHIKIIPIKGNIHKYEKCLTRRSEKDTMQIYFYVDGKLVMVSKELPIFDFRLLNDLKDKQEGVPFNISLGGGTQGLAESVQLNYMTPPEHILPLEKEFGGSFIGYLKSFKFYSCPLNYLEVQNNNSFSKKF